MEREESMDEKIRAWAAHEAGGPLHAHEFSWGALADEWVEVAVEYCGICHSDLSMLDNEWGRSSYPLVPGHEIVGRVVACGARAQRVQVGDRVGIGWFVGSCNCCAPCIAGQQHLCGRTQETIVGRPGGFAERVRAHWLWAEPLPEAIDPAAAGPLFCGGATVFSPIQEFDVRPTDRVGVVGIGGLGHLAVQFLKAWGCEVTAFTSSEAKAEEARRLGAHRIVNSRDKGSLKAEAGRYDFVLVTVNVALDWMAYVQALAPKGRLHFVGAVLEPVQLAAFGLIGGQKSVSGSPMARPATVAKMLAFCARHGIAPWVNEFAMSSVNEAIEHLRAGRARYRVVLKSDWAPD